MMWSGRSKLRAARPGLIEHAFWAIYAGFSPTWTPFDNRPPLAPKKSASNPDVIRLFSDACGRQRGIDRRASALDFK